MHDNETVDFTQICTFSTLNAHNFKKKFLFKVYDEVLTRLKKAYEQILHRMGDPLEQNTLVGPLHSEKSLQHFKNTIEEIKNEGGTIEFGGKVVLPFYSTCNVLSCNLDFRWARLFCATNNSLRTKTPKSISAHRMLRPYSIRFKSK